MMTTDGPFQDLDAKSDEHLNELRTTGPRKAWVTNALADMTGMSRTIESLGRVANQAGQNLTVVTGREIAPARSPVPLVSIHLGEDLEEVIACFERERFAELIISTAGPLGRVAIAAAQRLGLKVSGIFQSHFPRAIYHTANFDHVTQNTLRETAHFFGQMDTLFVPSESHRAQLIREGFNPAKLLVLRRGVDCTLFHPARRQECFWHRYGLGPGLKLLYVGRLSKEKNLDRLCEEFVLAQRRGINASLILVGDGPQADELCTRWQRHGVLFTGVLEGPTLATAYASADLFVFPSTTDTFGNAVLEAMACGLPAIVSQHGGPPETVGFYEAGHLADIYEPGRWADAIARLVQDEHLRGELSRRAVRTARESRWELVFDQLWHARAEAAWPQGFMDGNSEYAPQEVRAVEPLDIA